MLKDYNDIVKGLSEEEKKALRKDWEDQIVRILDDDTVAVSATVRLKKAQKYMLEAVRTLCFAFSDELTGYSAQCAMATVLDPHTHVAAICISTSDDPHARQLSSLVTDSSLFLSVVEKGDFDVKKFTNTMADLLRLVFINHIAFVVYKD